LNRDKRVKINTIALVDDGEDTETFINTLKRIADENGGVFKRVSPKQLF
jgi:hypothetical protein